MSIPSPSPFMLPQMGPYITVEQMRGDAAKKIFQHTHLPSLHQPARGSHLAPHSFFQRRHPDTGLPLISPLKRPAGPDLIQQASPKRQKTCSSKMVKARGGKNKRHKKTRKTRKVKKPRKFKKRKTYRKRN